MQTQGVFTYRPTNPAKSAEIEPPDNPKVDNYCARNFEYNEVTFEEAMQNGERKLPHARKYEPSEFFDILQSVNTDPYKSLILLIISNRELSVADLQHELVQIATLMGISSNRFDSISAVKSQLNQCVERGLIQEDKKTMYRGNGRSLPSRVYRLNDANPELIFRAALVSASFRTNPDFARLSHLFPEVDTQGDTPVAPALWAGLHIIDFLQKNPNTARIELTDFFESKGLKTGNINLSIFGPLLEAGLLAYAGHTVSVSPLARRVLDGEVKITEETAAPFLILQKIEVGMKMEDVDTIVESLSLEFPDIKFVTGTHDRHYYWRMLQRKGVIDVQDGTIRKITGLTDLGKENVALVPDDMNYKCVQSIAAAEKEKGGPLTYKECRLAIRDVYKTAIESDSNSGRSRRLKNVLYDEEVEIQKMSYFRALGFFDIAEYTDEDGSIGGFVLRRSSRKLMVTDDGIRYFKALKQLIDDSYSSFDHSLLNVQRAVDGTTGRRKGEISLEAMPTHYQHLLGGLVELVVQE